MRKVIPTLFAAMIMVHISMPAFAATYCARPTPYGTKDGSDWNNAVALSTVAGSSSYRGHTIYISGEYFETIIFDASESGTDAVTIKKATPEDHFTDSGWHASWGTQSAVFSRLFFNSDHWLLNGQYGRGAAAMYGVPDSSGYMDYLEYGIKVLLEHNYDQMDNIRIRGHNITLKYMEVASTTPPSGTWGKGCDLIQVYSPGYDATTISHCWLHDSGRTLIANERPTNFLVEYSVLERNGRNKVNHSEIYSQQQGGQHTTFQYNLIRDWCSTGGLILHSEEGAPGCQDFKIHGNIFTQTGYYHYDGSNGVIASLNKAPSTPHSFYVYNNTFANMAYGCRIGYGKNYSSRIIKNNIFYNCSLNDDHPTARLFGTHDYNWFFNSGPQSEPNIQHGSEDIFKDAASGDFHLNYDTTPGDSSIGRLYNRDIDGIVRDDDASWSRGAFDYNGGGNDLPPSAPSNLRVEEVRVNH